MKLGKLGLYFILSASAVLYAFAADLQKFEFLEDTTKKEMKITIGSVDFPLSCADAAQCKSIKDALTGRTKLAEVTLKENVPANLNGKEVLFADKKVMKFVASDKKFEITLSADEKPVAVEKKDLAAADIKLTASDISFGTIKVPAATQSVLDDLKKPNMQHVVTGATETDEAWAEGDADGLHFSVVRKDKIIYVFTTKSTGGLSTGTWGRYIQVGGLFLAFLVVFGLGMHFLTRAVDETTVTGGVSSSSVMPQGMKDFVLSEPGEIIDEIEEIGKEIPDNITGGPNGRRPTNKLTDGAKILGQEGEKMGTAEITLAAAFLLPFLL